MDLLGTVAIIVIVLIVIFTGAFLLLRHNTTQQFTSAQAVQFVLNDLKLSNPNAQINVLNVSNSTLKAGSYNIALSISYNSTRPCPTLFIEEFDYPATGLVPSVDNLYTKNCIIYGLSNASSNVNQYIIGSPEIAIARSYNQSLKNGITNVTYYVSTYGYNATNVTAVRYDYLNNNQTHLSRSFYNVWLIKYQAPKTNYSVYAVMYFNGSITDTFINSTK